MEVCLEGSTVTEKAKPYGGMLPEEVPSQDVETNEEIDEESIKHELIHVEMDEVQTYLKGTDENVIIYILPLTDGKFYVGSCKTQNSLDHELKQHQDGTMCQFTKQHPPIQDIAPILLQKQSAYDIAKHICKLADKYGFDNVKCSEHNEIIFSGLKVACQREETREPKRKKLIFKKKVVRPSLKSQIMDRFAKVLGAIKKVINRP